MKIFIHFYQVAKHNIATMRCFCTPSIHSYSKNKTKLRFSTLTEVLYPDRFSTLTEVFYPD